MFGGRWGKILVQTKNAPLLTGGKKSEKRGRVLKWNIPTGIGQVLNWLKKIPGGIY